MVPYASKNFLKTVHSVCVARRQHFPKNGVKRFVPHSVPLHCPFCFDGLPFPVFLATDPDSINLAKNLAIPRPVALIPSYYNFCDMYITTCFV